LIFDYRFLIFGEKINLGRHYFIYLLKSKVES